MSWWINSNFSNVTVLHRDLTVDFLSTSCNSYTKYSLYIHTQWHIHSLLTIIGLYSNKSLLWQTDIDIYSDHKKCSRNLRYIVWELDQLIVHIWFIATRQIRSEVVFSGNFLICWLENLLSSFSSYKKRTNFLSAVL